MNEEDLRKFVKGITDYNEDKAIELLQTAYPKIDKNELMIVFKLGVIRGQEKILNGIRYGIESCEEELDDLDIGEE
ncbi:MAG: hypothetical protein WC175_01810 [Candidatus Dojkabacteria bacterium]